MQGAFAETRNSPSNLSVARFSVAMHLFFTLPLFFTWAECMIASSGTFNLEFFWECITPSEAAHRKGVKLSMLGPFRTAAEPLIFCIQILAALNPQGTSPGQWWKLINTFQLTAVVSVASLRDPPSLDQCGVTDWGGLKPGLSAYFSTWASFRPGNRPWSFRTPCRKTTRSI